MNDVIIVGAGPAGLCAAIACKTHGLSIRIFDEFIKPGGRLLGQLHQEPNGIWWNGIEESKKLQIQLEDLAIPIECGVTVYDLEKNEQGWAIHTNIGIFQTKHVLLATGAAEFPTPLPGWTLPGVMSIGAAQVMTNVHRVKVGTNGMIIGANILSFAIMHELQLAGLEIDSIVLPPKHTVTKQSAQPLHVLNSLLHVAHIAPSPLLKFGSRFMKHSAMQKLAIQFYPKQGMKIWNVPLHLRKAAIEILGNQHVEAVKIATITPDGEVIPGTEEVRTVDFVCIAGGLYPLAELAAVAGCPFSYIEELGGHVPLHDETMATPLPGLYVAGNITGIESAKVAMAQGTVAGTAIAKERMQSHSHLDSLLHRAIQNVKTTRENATIQFHPHIAKGREQLLALSQQT
ncbi:NAD(P)/FAD-dependent oxidoreductase [Bacillus gaemokensis]|uniref:Sarcosine oxidase subunit alpha n=1 Tax=Bacillus gaemokensis TaxID=574375 RepID=A0A073KCH5_9BACI|nr:FAD-dependent oxidoreductase [Bacillus gaemokensis]KEK24236.1 sarcosine oxidase subunit alpha [Bacillus gaemokensis]KYG38248.1 sarcosine oxidase subunit alpha [Bacillus gaemokensis]